MTDTTVAVEPKPWWASVTIWVNIITFLMVALPLLGTYLSSAGFFDEASSARVLGGIAFLNSLLNLAMRFFITKTPIEHSPSAEGVTRTRTTPKVEGPG